MGFAAGAVTVAGRAMNDERTGTGAGWIRVERGILLMGCFFALWQYLSNPSFHLDECALALSPMERSFAGLTRPLVGGQAAPVGFLWLERIAVVLLGDGELSLRLVPLMAHGGALVLFAGLVRRRIPGLPGLVAFALMASSLALVTYSAVAKQYSAEVFTALLAARAVDPLFDAAPTHRQVATAAAAGLLLFFSYSLVFVLAGFGGALLIRALIGRRWGGETVALAGVLGIWAVSLGLVYLFSIRPQTVRGGLELLQMTWHGDFMPWSPAALVPWLLKKFRLLLIYAGTLRSWPLLVLPVLMGALWAWKERDLRTVGMMLAVPACLLASSLGRYPFMGRLILFLMPTIFVLVGLGVGVIRGGFGRGWRRAVDVGMVALALWSCVSTLRLVVLHENVIDRPREVIEFVARRWVNGDRLHLSPLAELPFRYYNRRDRIPAAGKVSTAPVRELRLEPGAKASRVWYLYMRTPWLAAGEADDDLAFLRARGRIVEEFHVELHSAVLAELPLAP